MLGNPMSQPCRAGLTFGGRPYGPQGPIAPSKNISRTSLQNCRSLGFARDDKGEGDASMRTGC